RLHGKRTPRADVAGGGAEGHDLGEIARQVADDDGAHESAEEGRAPAEEDVDHRAGGEGEAESVRVHEASPRGEQQTGETGGRDPDGEERELVDPDVVAEARDARLVLADADRHPPEPGAQEALSQRVDGDTRAEHEVVAGRALPV